MTLEHQKLDLIQWIASLQDEVLVSKVFDLKQKVHPKKVSDLPEQSERTRLLATTPGAKSYAPLKETPFDLEVLKKSQEVKVFTAKRLKEISKEADVQEPIEVLLNSID